MMRAAESTADEAHRLAPKSGHSRGHESPSRTDGFSLLESLIALVVFSIGFLALTLLMQTSLKNTNSAFYRSVATEQAYDMADRIRANRGAAGVNVVNYLTQRPPQMIQGVSRARLAVAQRS
ncbi:MAG: hypothetical protein CM1200mP41_24780 [Gammaproteobacteria bacterium]|nr:MAG: hypothetical protein CM1200mP41_24780 [Gammaproteobacteria bacterium]